MLKSTWSSVCFLVLAFWTKLKQNLPANYVESNGFYAPLLTSLFSFSATISGILASQTTPTKVPFLVVS